jgi:hypothetical protein
MGGKVLSKGIECNMSTHKYVYYELEFDLNNPYVLTEEGIWILWKLMIIDIFEDIEEATLVLR